jgi:hypothetical protein
LYGTKQREHNQARIWQTDRVVAELESAIKEKRIKTTPAQFAEDTWNRFK